MSWSCCLSAVGLLAISRRPLLTFSGASGVRAPSPHASRSSAASACASPNDSVRLTGSALRASAYGEGYGEGGARAV